MSIISISKLTRIGICGSGAMGTGIGQIAASQQCKVTFFDRSISNLEASKLELKEHLNTLVFKEKLSAASANDIFLNCKWTDKVEDLSQSDLIIEAIFENVEAKINLFKEIEQIVSKQCIISSNTSSIGITYLASALTLQDRFAGLHFFNPAPVMKLVEVIPALQTSQNVLQILINTMQQWNKVPVIAKDIPGFIVNRVARSYYSEALVILEEGFAHIYEIDYAMKSIGGFKMGPFELMDFIGHDVNYSVTKSVFEQTFFEEKYKPAQSQKKLVDANWLGRKSGRGFYDYSLEAKQNVTPNLESPKLFIIFNRIISMLINDGVDAVHRGFCSRADLEKAMTLGTNYPLGLLEWGRKIGYQNIKKQIVNLRHRYLIERYKPSKGLDLFIKEHLSDNI